MCERQGVVDLESIRPCIGEPRPDRVQAGSAHNTEVEDLYGLRRQDSRDRISHRVFIVEAGGVGQNHYIGGSGRLLEDPVQPDGERRGNGRGRSEGHVELVSAIHGQ